MISRRKILSRSRDELNQDFLEEEEDIWYNKDKLHKDHIQEVLNKWHQIDDEIWAKVICMERNRRVAKAYARASVLTISGSDDGFDGFRIGLCGFDNPLRDSKTEEVRKHIGNGVKIKMDDIGNILIKKITRANVYVKGTSVPDNSIANEICKQKGQIEMEKPVKLFDFKKFQSNVNRELKQAYPDRRKLESQCISTVCFVRNEPELLDCPCWIMIINVVALDMLKSKLPPISKKHSVPNMKMMNANRNEQMTSQTRLPAIGGHDDDPYSSAGSSSSSSQENFKPSRDPKPPKLPPRDSSPDPNKVNKNGNTKREKLSNKQRFIMRDNNTENRNSGHHLSSRKKMPHLHDDPYYCGMKARIPNFAKKDINDNNGGGLKKSHSSNVISRASPNRKMSYPDSGQDSDFTLSSDDAYTAAMYGRMRTVQPSLYDYQPRNRPPRQAFVGEWE